MYARVDGLDSSQPTAQIEQLGLLNAQLATPQYGQMKREVQPEIIKSNLCAPFPGPMYNAHKSCQDCQSICKI
jgi:hypothetical protein